MSLEGALQDETKAKKEKREKKSKQPVAEGSGGHRKKTEVKFHRPDDAPSSTPVKSANDPSTTSDEDDLTNKIKKLSLNEGEADKPPKREEIEKVLAATEEMVKKEDEDAINIHKQGAQVGRIHNNIDKTEASLEEAQEDLHATDSCCFAIWKAFTDALCCCCKPTHPAPHHDIDFEAQHPAPVVFNPANPNKPKTRKEEIAELKDAAHHLRETLEGETSELRDQNEELKVVIVDSDKVKKAAEDAQSAGTKILAKK